MADYIYLLENRLSPAQRQALGKIREVARAKTLTVFLVGGAVRDLTAGSPVRDLDVAVQGNALKLKKDLEKAGAVVTGEHEPMQSLFLRFPGSVRVELTSTMSATYPKPGKPVWKTATILEDLRYRDFTANAMALSLNDGSYGLLMDPLNGVADIETRQLRLVSPYGFIDDPSRLIRAARLAHRLGWDLEERTKTRYENGKAEDYISAMSAFLRGYEAEEIFHEEEPLRALKKLEAEGWMKNIFPAFSSAKANTTELDKVHASQTQLQLQGIMTDASAINFPLLTAKMKPEDVKALKKSFARPGFADEIHDIETRGKAFANELSGKGAATPSQAWKLIMSSEPEAVLWTAYSSKNSAIQNRLKSFFTEWPTASQRIPYALLTEMRITSDLPIYEELLNKLFFELMDNKLGTPEEMKAYLEPFSPPAPPPPVNLRRPRAAKKDAKPSKARAKKAAAAAAAAPAEGDTAAVATDAAAVPAKETKQPAPAKGAKAAAAPAKAAPAKAVPAKAAPAKAAPAKAVKTPAKAAPPAKKAAPAKAVKKAAPVKKVAAKAPAKKKAASKPAPKPAAKAVAKKPVAKKPAPAKKAPAKPAAKKPAAKPSAAKKAAKKR